MSDFLREVDEDYRRERMVQLWKRFGPWLIGAAGVIILMVAAGVAWRDHVAKRQGQQAESYQAALTALETGETDLGLARLAELETEGGGIAALAMLSKGQTLTGLGRREEAVSTYQALAALADAPAELRSLGSLRAAMLRLDSAPIDELRAELATLAVPGQPWSASATELIALALIRDGKPEDARSYLDLLFADPETPPEIRTRTGYYLELIGPPPAPAEASGQPAGEAP